MKKRIVFRADGNSLIGLGHVVRSLALLEMVRSEYDCVFVTRKTDEAVRKLILSYCELKELPHNSSIEEEVSIMLQLLNKQDILILDFYKHDERYQQAMKSAVCKIVAVDDNAAIHFYADLIINHGIGTRENLYRKENYTRLLGGFKYLLIREEFRIAARMQRQITSVKKLFVCMGGADPFNVTNKVLDATVHCSFIETIIVVTGSAYRFLPELKQRLRAYPQKIQHSQNVSAAEMVRLISASQIAVAPASSVSMEICSVRAGLLTGTVVDNQEGTHSQLIASGCAISAGDLNSISVSDITEKIDLLNNLALVRDLVRNQELMIDGLSGERILHEFQSFSC